MVEQLTHNLVLTHSSVFVLGMAFDYFVFQKLVHSKKIKIDPAGVIRLLVLMSMLLLYAASLISFQFYNGHEPNIVFSLIGAFAFGSLVGEKSLIVEIIHAVTNKQK